MAAGCTTIILHPVSHVAKLTVAEIREFFAQHGEVVAVGVSPTSRAWAERMDHDEPPHDLVQLAQPTIRAGQLWPPGATKPVNGVPLKWAHFKG